MPWTAAFCSIALFKKLCCQFHSRTVHLIPSYQFWPGTVHSILSYQFCSRTVHSIPSSVSRSPPPPFRAYPHPHPSAGLTGVPENLRMYKQIIPNMQPENRLAEKRVQAYRAGGASLVRKSLNILVQLETVPVVVQNSWLSCVS